jgi:PAS domain S-box-containing protein
MTENRESPIILIVEDSAINLGILSRSLSDAGYEVAVAVTGEQAIAVLSRVNPELILLDVEMPGMDGFETCHRLKANPATSEIPVIFMTAHDGTTDKLKGLSIGAVDYITKPFDHAVVLARINVHLKLGSLGKTLKKQNARLAQEIKERAAAEAAFRMLTEELDRRVEERTGELSQAIRKIAKLYDELHESEGRWAQFLDAVPVGVFVINASGVPQYANRRAHQLVGKGVVPDVEIAELAKTYQLYLAGTSQLYPTDQLPGVRALRGERVTVDDTEIHLPGRTVPVETWATPIFDEKGNIPYAIIAFQEISERKRLEVERTKFTNDLFELNKSYERFVPRRLLQLLGKESIVDVRLGDCVQKEMSVLLSDIRAFAAMTEGMTPAENFEFLNSYFGCVEPVIMDHRGLVDKYIGDAIMALFSNGIDDAVMAGIAMLRALDEYNAHRARGDQPPIRIGIGINTGRLMLGTVGGHGRMDGRVVSDAVTFASQIESLTHHYEVSLLISHHVVRGLREPGRYCLRMVDQVRVKGGEDPVSVFEVFDADPAELRDGKLATKAMLEEAWSLHGSNDLGGAARLLRDCLRLNPADKVVQLFLARCQP